MSKRYVWILTTAMQDKNTYPPVTLGVYATESAAAPAYADARDKARTSHSHVSLHMHEVLGGPEAEGEILPAHQAARRPS